MVEIRLEERKKRRNLLPWLLVLLVLALVLWWVLSRHDEAPRPAAADRRPVTAGPIMALSTLVGTDSMVRAG